LQTGIAGHLCGLGGASVVLEGTRLGLEVGGQSHEPLRDSRPGAGARQCETGFGLATVVPFGMTTLPLAGGKRRKIS
jgi:hypothetical protein